MVAKIVPRGKEDGSFILPQDQTIIAQEGFQLLGEGEQKMLKGDWSLIVQGTKSGFKISTEDRHGYASVEVTTDGVDWKGNRDGWSIRDQIKEPESDRPYWEMSEGTRIEPITPLETYSIRASKER